MEAKHIILSRLLPKTGQETSYAAGDDGVYEAGWWRRRLNTNNKTRFIDYTINGNDIVIDRATKLWWPKNAYTDLYFGSAVLSWTEHLVYCNNLIFAERSDWRMPNLQELFSLFHFVVGTPYIWPAIQGIQVGDYWTSTTIPVITTRAFICDFYSNLWIERVLKTGTARVIPVRGGL